MSTWNNANIRFQYTSGHGSGVRSITAVTLQIYGRSESAVLDKLRKTYPHWRDFVLLDVRWAA